jgi:hypothetical protein
MQMRHDEVLRLDDVDLPRGAVCECVVAQGVDHPGDTSGFLEDIELRVVGENRSRTIQNSGLMVDILAGFFEAHLLYLECELDSLSQRIEMRHSDRLVELGLSREPAMMKVILFLESQSKLTGKK